MSKLTIGEAAAVLHTAPSTIRSWEQRLGYPTPDRSTSGRRLYDEHEVALLADALRRGLSISSAIRQIREETGSHDALLRQALSDLDVAACDALVEAAIALRGVSRAFDETVLTVIESLASIGDPGVVALAVHWACDRACWARRQAVTTPRHDIVVIDGSGDGTATRAACCVLQLQLTLWSARTHVLHGVAGSDWRAVARRLDAGAVVFVGAVPDGVLRESTLHAAPVASFRANGELPRPHVQVLPSTPRLAAELLLGAAAPNGTPATVNGAR